MYAMEVLADPVFVTNLEKDVYNMTGTFSKTTILDLKADKGLNLLRNDISSTGTAKVINNLGDAEYTLKISSPNDSCSLITSEYGSYSAGKTAEIGISMRLPFPLQGSQILKWGYFNDLDGVYFMKTNTQFFVCIMRNGIETKFEQAAFNRDHMDGTTGSYKTLNFADGNIFRINFSWYGYGSVQFSVLGVDSSGSQKMLPIHVFQTIGQTSTQHPCLPLSVTLNNGTINSSPATVFIAGRQYSLLGTYNPMFRMNGIYSLNKICPINVSTPILSIQRDLLHLSFKTILSDISINVSHDTYIEIRSQTILINSSFTSIPNAETCIEYDISATGVSLGTILWCDVIPQNVPTKIKFENIDLHFKQITICGKSLHQTEDSNISYTHINWKTEW